MEDEVVSETVLKLVSLQLWHSLSVGRFQVKFKSFHVVRLVSADTQIKVVHFLCFVQMELCLNPHLIKKWKKLTKKEAKEAKKAGVPFDPSKMLEVKFLKNLIEEFLEVFSSTIFPLNNHTMLYIYLI